MKHFYLAMELPITLHHKWKWTIYIINSQSANEGKNTEIENIHVNNMKQPTRENVWLPIHLPRWKSISSVTEQLTKEELNNLEAILCHWKHDSSTHITTTTFTQLQWLYKITVKSAYTNNITVQILTSGNHYVLQQQLKSIGQFNLYLN